MSEGHRGGEGGRGKVAALTDCLNGNKMPEKKYPRVDQFLLEIRKVFRRKNLRSFKGFFLKGFQGAFEK